MVILLTILLLDYRRGWRELELLVTVRNRVLLQRSHAVAVGKLVFGHQLFRFPNVLFATDRELEIFLCDGIPVLIDHHDSKQ